MPPLTDFLVIDFSTLLPGQLASPRPAEVGAQVIKIERPDDGDAMRTYKPIANGESLLLPCSTAASSQWRSI